MDKQAQLKLLREPFADNQISKLPKPTKKQTDMVKDNYTNGIRCTICGGWHHKDVVHLDYVGHAALTDRFLKVDPEWSWEPVAFDANGLPAIKDGLLWIKLTLCGVTRYGVGDAQGKSGGDAVKEMIGDALRNAGMRFGCALDLWHKGDLHADDDQPAPKPTPKKEPATEPADQFRVDDFVLSIMESGSMEDLQAVFAQAYRAAQNDQIFTKQLIAAKDKRKAQLEKAA